MCSGTDAAADCSAGQCPFQARMNQIRDEDEAARLAEEAALNDALSPRRCETNEVDAGGECEHCGAVSGEACRKPRLTLADVGMSSSDFL